MSRKTARPFEDEEALGTDRDEEDPGGNVGSDLIRRMAALGLSGFFTTESAIRRAFGDTVPKDWVDFASDQSERTRKEVIDRMTQEMAKQLAETDVADLLSRFLSGHTVEINAKVTITPRDDGDSSTSLRTRVEFESE